MGKSQRFFLAAIIIVVGALLVARPGFGGTPTTDIGEATTEERDQVTEAEVVDYGDDIAELAAYRIEDSALAGETNPEHEAIWQLVLDVVPASVLEDRLVQFNVSTDGRDRTLAMVHRSGRFENGWILTVDSADTADLNRLTETLVHELAHVLTLGRDVVDFGVEEPDCEFLATQVGCVQPDSTMGRYVTEFWLEGATDGAFVTNYANTSAHEDLAETFMAWVLDLDVPDEVEIAPKYAFLESEPIMVEAKAAIAANLNQ